MQFVKIKRIRDKKSKKSIESVKSINKSVKSVIKKNLPINIGRTTKNTSLTVCESQEAKKLKVYIQCRLIVNRVSCRLKMY